MATPTVTQISSFTDGQRGNGQNLRPTTAYRITGGTADDRLTMDEVVADSTISNLMSFDPDTGVVKRVGNTPTPYTFIFGSAAPQTAVASGSSTTVLNVVDATGFTTTGKVRVNNDGSREREIDSISGNTITLSSALPSTPGTGQRVKFLEDSDNITPDCYVELVGVTFDLHSNAGTDTTAQDLGDETDKIIFSDYCDVVIGSDVGDPTAPDVGNCSIITENFSWNFYNYVEVFQEGTKVTCNGYLKFILKGNSRPSLVNRNSNSKIRVILGGHSVSPFADNFRCNVDLSVDTQEIIMYGGQMNFRPSLVPGGIQSDEFILPAATAANGGTVYLYWQNSPFASTGYTVRGLQTIREVGETEQPQVDVQSADGSDMLVKLAEFGGKRADEFFRFSADDGHLTTEISQKLNFKIRDAGNSMVTAFRLKINTGSYDITYSPSDLGTPTISTTDYDETQNFEDISDQEVEINSKVFACNEGINQDFREVSASSIVSAELNPYRYSIWAWGYDISYHSAFTLDDEMGENDLVVVLPENDLITSATIDDVPSEAATFDDIYDMLAKYAFDNQEDIACSVSEGLLTFTDDDVTLSTSGSLTRSSGTLTIPCADTLETGTKITSIKVTNDLTIPVDINVEGSYSDRLGIIVRIVGYTSGHRATAGAWPASQGTLNRDNIVTTANYITRTDVSIDSSSNTLSSATIDFRVFGVGTKLIMSGWDNDENNTEADIATVAADGTSCTITHNDGGSFVTESAGNEIEIENGDTTVIQMRLEENSQYYFVADAVSYLRSPTFLLDTSVITTVIGSLTRITDSAGDDLIPVAADLTDDEKDEIALIEYDYDDDKIYFGASSDTNEYTFRAVARAIEVGQSRTDALSNPYICTIRTGSFTFENDSDRQIARASGISDSLVPDLSGFQFKKIGTSDLKDYVDYEKGAIIVNGGDPAVVTLNVGNVDIPQTRFNERMDNVTDSIKDTYKNEDDGAINAVGSSIFGSSFKGEWEAGTYIVDDIVWFTDKFYKCTTARSSTDTDDPATDTSSWEVAKVAAGGGSSLDQTTFNTRMENVPDSTKDTYKGTGGTSSYSESNLHTHLDSYTNKDDWKADVSSIPTSNPSAADIVTAIQAADFGAGDGTQTLSQQFEILLDIIGSSVFGEDFKGEWSAGTYDEEDVVWFTDRFYTCTTSRTSADTDDPITDTSSWRVASGMVYSQIINAYYDPFGN